MIEKGDTKEDVTVYEAGFLILPSIPEDRLSSVVESMKKIITSIGGVEIDGEEPFKYPLAYTMSKTIGASRYVVSEAYLGWIKFELEPEKIATVKDGLEKMEEILRLLIVKAPRKTEFTFAKARAEQETMEQAEREAKEDAEGESEVVDSGQALAEGVQ
jgi:ribosomal protein S6